MPTTAPVADDVTVEELWDDPYPVYARLRREAPVCWVPAVGLWFVSRWADVETAAADPVAFPAAVPGSTLDRTLGGRSVLTVDGDDHAHWRTALDRSLRPRAVEAAAPHLVLEITDQLLDEMAERGRAELMSEYFEPLSVLSLAHLVGIGHVDGPTLQRWFHGLSVGASNFEADPAKQARADAVSQEIDHALHDSLAQRFAEPDDSMVSHLLEAVPGTLDERVDALMPTFKLVLIGGLQEPGHGAGSTALGLLQDPEQWSALVADPAGLVRKAVDEGLRWLSPIGEQTRGSGPGAELSGVRVPEGQRVALLVASANRDASVFGPTADEFDLFRPRHPHAGFGFGPHFCVGHYLARLQVRTAIQRLAERFPSLRLDEEQPVLVRGWEYRAPTALHVRWDA
jgi:cytochrome P450